MRYFASWFLLQAALIGATAVPASAQASADQTAETGSIAGTVRDAASKPVTGASVLLIAGPAESPNANSVSTKTAMDGTFAFSAIRAGQLTLTVRAASSPIIATQSLILSAGEKKHIDLVLAAQAPAASGNGNASQGPSTAAMQFSDQPNFTVSGMTDYSNLGLHGSEATARTSDALTKETLGLKAGGTHGNAGSAGATVDAAAHRSAGDRDEKAGDPVAAVHEYETAARLDASEENYFAWGSELLLHHAKQPAGEVFAKGAAAHPDSSRMLAGLGAALYASGQFDEAARKLCAASDLNPADATPYLFLGKMEETATAPIPCGEEKLARFAQLQPANALANYYYALSLTKRERASDSDAGFGQIETLLRKSVSFDPKLGEAYLQLGILYLSQGDFTRAVEVLQKAVAAKPELGLAHYRLGQAYKRTGQDAKAQEEFAAYARCEKADAEARERERRELRQFLVILNQPATSSPPASPPAPWPR